MKENVRWLIVHLRGIWRFRWHAVVIAWGAAVLGWFVVLALPDVYEARARVYIDTDSVLRPLLSGLAVNADMTNRVGMISAVLMSRPNLERVAHETDLHLRTKSPEEFQRLVDDLPKRLTLAPGGRDGTYAITFSDHDRNTAYRVVQTLLNTFVEDSLGLKRADTTSAQRFIEEQIKDLETRLTDAENRLAEFKRKNVGLMPGETGDYYVRLQTAMQGLSDLQAKYKLALERRDELNRQLTGEEPTLGLLPSPGGGASVYDGKIAELHAKLDALLLQYTEKHPDVIAIRETIADLEKQKRALKEQGADGAAAVVPPGAKVDSNTLALRALDINPVYQSMKIALSQTELELVELRAKISDSQRDVHDLQSRVDTIPDVEAELKRLNRDYETNREQHTQLLQRLDQARLSQDVEQSTEQVKFRIIEPPTLPLLPIGPNRPLLISAAFLLGLLAAAGMAVLLDQLKPVFANRSILHSVTGLPVLGSIALLRRKGEIPMLRQQWALVAGCFAALAVAYVVALELAEWASRAVHSLLS